MMLHLPFIGGRLTDKLIVKSGAVTTSMFLNFHIIHHCFSLSTQGIGYYISLARMVVNHNLLLTLLFFSVACSAPSVTSHTSNFYDL